jgi:DNA-binding MarR family transcriptional regulator
MFLLLANKLQIWGDGILEDITLKQWFLLMLISKMAQKPTIKEIADFSGTSRQNTKKMLEQLAKKNYIRINKSKTDDRALNVVLTKKTYSFFADNEKKTNDSLRTLFTEIHDDELVITEKTLEKILAVFKVSPLKMEEL